VPDAFAKGSPREVILDAPPAMLPQYLRAALPSIGPRSDAVPELVLRLSGLRPRPEDVARYSAVVGQPPSDRLPLLYPHVLGFGLQMKIMTDSSFPFPALGLVHVTNEVTCTRPIPLGAELAVAVHAGAVRPHPKGRVVDLITVVRCDGEPVWTETSSYLRRERTGDQAADKPATGSAATASGSKQDGVSEPDGVPELHFSARRRLPGDLGRQYARVSGDLNPIHLTALTARPLGFPRAIAHGMWTAAAVLGALEGRLPDALTYTVQFRRPITLPSTVRLFTGVAGEHVVAEVRGGDGDDRVHLVADVQSARRSGSSTQGPAPTATAGPAGPAGP
jgi:acyl dehydratase